MNSSSVEQVILSRFRQRCHIAGNIQRGYGMRAQAIRYVQPEHPGLDINGGLDAMVAKGWLKVNEARTWYYLTEEGAEQVKQAS